MCIRGDVAVDLLESDQASGVRQIIIQIAQMTFKIEKRFRNTEIYQKQMLMARNFCYPMVMISITYGSVGQLTFILLVTEFDLSANF